MAATGPPARRDEDPLASGVGGSTTSQSLEASVELGLDRDQPSLVALGTSALARAADADEAIATTLGQVVSLQAQELAGPDPRVGQEAHDDFVAFGRPGSSRRSTSSLVRTSTARLGTFGA